MKTQFTTRIENDILDRIKEISEDERRTVNNTIELLLAIGIAAYDKERNPPQPAS